MAIIPDKNPKALIAYYLAVFSLIPCLGLPLGIAAVILGFLGLSAANQHPEIEGKGHALTGIILGGITTLLWGGLTLMAVLASLSAHA